MIKIVKLFTLALILVVNITKAQTKIGDNHSTINGGSLLELESSNKGFLLTRISLSKTSLWGLDGSPINGMTVYNINSSMTGSVIYPTLKKVTGVYYWDGTGWVAVGITNTPEQTVDVNGVTCSQGSNTTFTGGIFTPNSPAVENYLYVNTCDGQTYSYNSITNSYQAYTYLGGTEWELENTNLDAFGNKTKQIRRKNSVSIGAYSWASGGNSLAVGQNDTTTGFSSIVSGYLNFNKGPNSIIAGSKNYNVNALNFIFGMQDSINSGSYNLVTGSKNIIPDGGYNFINGFGNINNGFYSTLTGFENINTINGGRSFVSGSGNLNSGTNSTVIGNSNYNLDLNNYIMGSRDSVFVGISNFLTGQNNTLKNGNNNLISGKQNYLNSQNIGANQLLGFNDSLLTGQYNIISGSSNSSYLGNSNSIFGESNTNNGGSFSVIAGKNNKIGTGTSINSSVTIGENNTANFSNSFALGKAATTTKTGQLVLGFAGGVVINNIPVYASDAAADADLSLPKGSLYKLNGSRAVYQKP